MAPIMYAERIEEKLSELKKDEKVKVDDFLEEYWGTVNHFVKRCFDVHFSKARSILKEKGMIFKRVKGVITRLE